MTNKTTMEERFDERFTKGDRPSKLMTGFPKATFIPNSPMVKDLKDFTRSEISQAITARDQQWIEAVGKDNVILGFYDYEDEDRPYKVRNELRHEILDTMGVEK